MFITNKAQAKQIFKAPKRSGSCSNCGNTSEHVLYWWEEGAFLRFAGMHLAGKKGYGYVCGVCGDISATLSKEQAKSLGA